MKISKIEEVKYTGSTYNLHVQNNHNYFGNNLVVKNCHRFASNETSAIVKETINCKYKWGFTGTLPEDPVMKMELFGLFGLPKTYITSSGLIEKGLATPVKIKSVLFRYNNVDKQLFKQAGSVYTKQLKFIKEHERRNEFVVNLASKIIENGNTLVLGQHVDHLKTLYLGVMKKLYPEIKEIHNKQITGKGSFDFQENYGVYYISGTDDAKTRELTRKILEEDLFSIHLSDNSILRLHGNKIVQLNDGSEKNVNKLTDSDVLHGEKKIEKIAKQNQLLVSGYQLLSTGVNIKKLHNCVLASPLKAYTTITQSIGRGMRLHESKSVFNVFDLVDCTNFKGDGGIFHKQYQHRLKTSYNPEDFPVSEHIVNLF
jgi:superfamily II DNA or RNA helicase